MNFCVPRIRATEKTTGITQWVYTGLVIEISAGAFFVTTTLLGSRDTHTFYLETVHRDIQLDTIIDCETPLLLLIKTPPSHPFTSTVSKFAEPVDYWLDTKVTCVSNHGIIDEIDSYIEILRDDAQTSLLGDRLIRATMNGTIQGESLVGAPLMLSETACAVGIIIAQDEMHVYALPACELEKIGRNLSDPEITTACARATIERFAKEEELAYE